MTVTFLPPQRRRFEREEKRIGLCLDETPRPVIRNDWKRGGITTVLIGEVSELGDSD